MPLSNELAEFGFTSMNSVRNMGSAYVYMIGVIAMICSWAIMRLVSMTVKIERVQRVEQYIENKARWSFPIALI